ncbi:MAG: hypothetical protein ACI9HE_003516 [Planctomycetota bacterium]|jgi:hypothetical protein
MRQALIRLVTCLFVLAPFSTAQNSRSVQVYVLAGQSNMVGKAQNKLLEYQANAEPTRAHFEHLRKDGEWIVRDDAFIKFGERRGGLTIGYGSSGRTGPELGFGTCMAEKSKQPILLIKTAWGGHSLYQAFRPPSRGLPDTAILEAELAKAVANTEKRNAKNDRKDPLPTMEEIEAAYGQSYRNMLADVRSTMKDCSTLFPELKGKRLELAGFVWFQGWNDQYNGVEAEYEVNMQHFIQDVRKDLDAPKLPFVIALMGQNGSTPAKGPMLVIQEAQLAMNKVHGFAGNVLAIRTDTLVDKAAETVYQGWKDHVEEWEKVGSDHAYHYLGSAIWFDRIGTAMGQAMLRLQQ